MTAITMLAPVLFLGCLGWGGYALYRAGFKNGYAQGLAKGSSDGTAAANRVMAGEAKGTEGAMKDGTF